jgi:hypothetical protein
MAGHPGGGYSKGRERGIERINNPRIRVCARIRRFTLLQITEKEIIMEKCKLNDNKLCNMAKDYPSGVSCTLQAILKGKKYLLSEIKACPRKGKP